MIQLVLSIIVGVDVVVLWLGCLPTKVLLLCPVQFLKSLKLTHNTLPSITDMHSNLQQAH